MTRSIVSTQAIRWLGGHSARLAPWVFALLYAGSALLVDPRGEFPLNDDWSYTRSAFRWASEGRMAVDEWSAPNLVGQALYGGWLVRAAGASFTALRLSTLVLAWGLACLLWSACRRVGASPGLAYALTIAFCFNPVAFPLSFTFMTEIPFLFFVSLAFYCRVRQAQGETPAWIAASGAALGYAFLIRQTALLFAAAVSLELLAYCAFRDRRGGVRRLALWLAAFLPLPAIFVIWERTAGGARPAAERKFELLHHLTLEQLAGNFFGALFYLAFFLAPALLPILRRAGPRARAGISGTAALGTIALCGLFWFQTHYARGPYLAGAAYHRQMPYLLNILYDTGVGPVTLDPTYYGPLPTPAYPAAWRGITLFTAAALALFGGAWTAAAAALRWKEEPQPRRTALVTATVAFASVLLFETVFSHIQEGGLFDRHLLSALLPLVWSAAALFGAGAPQTALGRSAAPASAILALAAVTAFSIAATHDYLAWNRLRWDLGRELLARGTDPLVVSGGFEFNAWHNYDTFRARGNIGKVFYWWYDRPEFVLAMEAQEGYRVLERRTWFSWLHRRRFPLYLLQKDMDRR